MPSSVRWIEFRILTPKIESTGVIGSGSFEFARGLIWTRSSLITFFKWSKTPWTEWPYQGSFNGQKPRMTGVTNSKLIENRFQLALDPWTWMNSMIDNRPSCCRNNIIFESCIDDRYSGSRSHKRIHHVIHWCESRNNWTEQPQVGKPFEVLWAKF